MSRYMVFLGAPRSSQPSLTRQDGSEKELVFREYDWDLDNISNTVTRAHSQVSVIQASLNASDMYAGDIFEDKQWDDDYAYSFGEGHTDGVPDSIRTQAEGDTTITSTDNQDDSALSLKDILTNSSSEHKISSEEPTSLSISVENSETSVRLPTLRIPVHLLSSLTDLLGGAKSHPSRAIKVSIVAALLDLEGPEFILVKKGADAGRRVGLLKLVLGDEDGHIATLSVWRELAEEWANQIRKGDILLLQNLLFAHQNTGPPTLTASYNLKSTMAICYRTHFTDQRDLKLQPDLRFARGDPGLAKVARTLDWFKRLQAPPE